MTQLDIHPEHLIDRVLRGAASVTERAELALHVRSCPGCAAEWQLACVLREPVTDAAEPVSGAVDAALAELTRDGRLLPAPVAPHAAAPIATRAWLPWAVALCLFFTGSAAAATLIMAVRSNADATQAAALSAARERERVERKRSSGVAHAPRVGPAPAASVVPPVAVSPSPDLASARPAVPRVRHAATPKAELSAGELFAQARATATQGDYAGAAALYATLEQRFATSPQAHVSQVVLGRLYLEHLTDPRAALAHFDAYLVQGGANRPEALLGRARALRALGRVAEEIETLQQLVAAYPDSLYVVPAQERLRAVK